MEWYNETTLEAFMDQPAVFMTAVSGPNGTALIKTEEITLKECAGLAALNVITGNNILPDDDLFERQNTESQVYIAYDEGFSVGFCYLPNSQMTYQMFEEMNDGR